MSRHNLFWPILLGSLAILFTVAISVGWNVMFSQYYILNKKFFNTSSVTGDPQTSPLPAGYWALLAVGDILLLTVLSVLIAFLMSNVRKELTLRRQNVFIDSVTHELKSPLASLRLALDTLRMRQMDARTRGRFHHVMQADVDRLQSFIERILAAGQLEHGRHELARAPTDLSNLVIRTVERVRQAHALDHAEVNYRIEADVPRFGTDAAAIESVLTNLLDNAIKYSHDQVHVQVVLSDNPEGPRISVRDRGVGLPAGQAKRIFGRFVRLDRPSDMRVRGTGLGLYLAQAIIRRLDGRIWATSSGEGRGTTFHIQLRDAEDAPRRTVLTPLKERIDGLAEKANDWLADRFGEPVALPAKSESADAAAATDRG